jgi:hypothetical protein
MWARNGNIAGIEMNWNDAMSWVNSSNNCGYRDWRLPTKEELENFLKHGGKHPSKWFNTNGFNSVQSNYYWSSSTYDVNNTATAWGVNMVNGHVGIDSKNSHYYVWPVRAGR